MVVSRNEVWLISLNPSVGSEIKKMRPCVIISPDEANKFLETITIVPLTSTWRNYPTRVPCKFNQKKGQLVIDQIRTVDKVRLRKKLGVIDKQTAHNLFKKIEEYFKFE